jgi:hypothetical protein
VSAGAWLQLVVYLAVLLALAWPLARWIDAVMAGRFALGRRLEAPLFRAAGIRPDHESGWLRYATGLLIFNGLGVLAVFALQRLQAVLPLNPQAFGAVSPDSAVNTAISFVTNTHWQGCGGEATMSDLTQMLALTVQNFLSAATGSVVVIALVRGFTRHCAQAIGNVWVDLTRVTLWILLPLSFVLALGFAAQGVVQNLAAHQDAGHRWRRLLQRQLGASVREPDRAQQRRPDAGDLRDPRCRRTRPDGTRRPAAGSSVALGHGGYLLAANCRSLARPGAQASMTTLSAFVSAALAEVSQACRISSSLNRCVILDAMHAHVGDRAAAGDDVLAQLEGGRDADCFDGGVHPAAIGQLHQLARRCRRSSRDRRAGPGSLGFGALGCPRPFSASAAPLCSGGGEIARGEGMRCLAAGRGAWRHVGAFRG